MIAEDIEGGNHVKSEDLFSAHAVTMINIWAAQLLPISWKATIAGSGIDEESK